MTRWQRWVYRTLKPVGRKTLRNLIITLCAGDREVLTRIRVQRVILRAENFVQDLPMTYFILFKLTLYLLEYALPPLSWKIIPFSRMSLRRRLEYVGEWQASHFYYKRMMFKLLSTVCVAHLYSERRLLTSIGFESSMEHRMNRL